MMLFALVDATFCHGCYSTVQPSDEWNVLSLLYLLFIASAVLLQHPDQLQPDFCHLPLQLALAQLRLFRRCCMA